MSYQTYVARKPPKSPLATTEWSGLLLRDVIYSERVPFRRCRGWWDYMTQQFSVLPLVTLTFDLWLDIQTRPSEGPNTSSLWICRKYIKPFPRYLIHKQNDKSHRHGKTKPYLRAVINTRLLLLGLLSYASKLLAGMYHGGDGAEKNGRNGLHDVYVGQR